MCSHEYFDNFGNIKKVSEAPSNIIPKSLNSTLAGELRSFTRLKLVGICNLLKDAMRVMQFGVHAVHSGLGPPLLTAD